MASIYCMILMLRQLLVTCFGITEYIYIKTSMTLGVGPCLALKTPGNCLLCLKRFIHNMPAQYLYRAQIYVSDTSSVDMHDGCGSVFMCAQRPRAVKKCEHSSLIRQCTTLFAHINYALTHCLGIRYSPRSQFALLPMILTSSS